MHLKGHVDPRCKKRFDPKKNKLLRNVNTQVAEQTFSWFACFKHIGRYMNRVSYWIFIIGLFHFRNVITVRRSEIRQRRKRDGECKLSPPNKYFKISQG